MTRYDMHAAFSNKQEVIDILQAICKQLEQNNPHDFFRPRIGIFVQADCCLKSNPSKYSIIPTFTCNFNTLSGDDAESIMNNIMDILFKYDTSGILKNNLLRVRCEGQLSILKFNPESDSMKYVESIPKNFPTKVQDLQYFDAHIHILGLTKENVLEKWAIAANIGAELDMPIIINKLKVEQGIVKPFLTKRWYNVSLDEAIKSLGETYKIIYKMLNDIGLKVTLMPEFEVTMNDPDCQVTDQGWMPTPFCVFKLNEDHCVLPGSIFESIIN